VSWLLYRVVEEEGNKKEKEERRKEREKREREKCGIFLKYEIFVEKYKIKL
jgi:hypothetical protein